MCMPGACKGQKRELDPLKLALRMTVSYHVKAGNCTWVLCKNKCCKLESLLSSPWRRSFSVNTHSCQLTSPCMGHFLNTTVQQASSGARAPEYPWSIHLLWLHPSFTLFFYGVLRTSSLSEGLHGLESLADHVTSLLRLSLETRSQASYKGYMLSI